MMEAAPSAARPRGKWFAQKPERHHAQACYRYILGREPESEAALESQVARSVSIADLRASFLQSADFHAQVDPTAWLSNLFVFRRPSRA